MKGWNKSDYEKRIEQLEAELDSLKASKGCTECPIRSDAEDDVKKLKAEIAKEKKDSKWYEKKLRNCVCPDCGFGFSGV